MLKTSALLAFALVCTFIATDPIRIPPPHVLPSYVSFSGAGQSLTATVTLDVIRDGAVGNFMTDNGIFGQAAAHSKISIEFPQAANSAPYTYDLTSADIATLNAINPFGKVSFNILIGESPTHTCDFVVRSPVIFGAPGNNAPCVNILKVVHN